MTSVSKKVARNTFYVLFGRIGCLIFNVLTVVFLARYLGENDFGIFSYGLVFVGLFVLLPDFGMKPIMVREISKNRSEANEIICNSLFLKISFSIVAIVLANGFAFFLFSDDQLRVTIFILSFIILFSSRLSTIRITFEAIFHADMDLKYPVSFQLLDSFLQTTMVLILILLKGNYVHILIVYVFACFPGLVFTLHVFLKKIQLTFKLKKDTIFWLLKQSFPLFIYLAISMIYDRLDVFLIKHFWGDSQVGIYSSAFRLTIPLSFIPVAIITAIYPVMSKLRQDKDNTLHVVFSLISKILIGLGLSAGVFGVLIGRPIFMLLYGDRYISAVTPFQLLLWGQAFIFLTFFIVDYNNSQSQQKKNMYFIGTSLILCFVLSLIIIPRYGIVGAACLKIFLYIVGFFILFIFSYRFIPFRLSYIFLRTLVFLLILLLFTYLPYLDRLGFEIKSLFLIVSLIIFIIKLFSKNEWLLMQNLLTHFIKNRQLLDNDSFIQQ